MFSRITIAFLLIIGVASATTYYVPDDYPTIQDAINACVDGDVVIVRPGTYVENIDFIGKAITVKSESGPDVTIIDGNQAGSVVVFQNGEGNGSVLEGFSITNGSASDGGGIICSNSSPLLSNNILSGNTASNLGGGLYASINAHPIVIDCTFSGNSAGRSGGGMYIYGHATISNSTFSGNTAGWFGGGIYLYFSGSVTISDCTLSQNSANKGGGLTNYQSSPTVINCTFSGNSGSGWGGGFYNMNNSNPALTNCTFSGNSAPWGGGMNNSQSSPTVINCTFSGNSSSNYGGGIYSWNTSSPTVTNCIIWANTPDNLSNDATSIYSVSYSCVEGGYSGTGNIDTDPLFVDPANDDFHLTWDSPCKDTGDNSAVTEPTDFEGDPRIADGTVDMGADEFHEHLYYLGNVIPTNPISIRVVGTPMAPVTLALGAGIQDPPQSTLYGDLYLTLPLVMTFNLGGVSTNGILVFPANVPTNWQSGQSYPFQVLVGPQAPGSVLTNLMVLVVE